MLSGRAISFTIPGRMRGKGRPRARMVGGFAQIHPDEKTASAEAMVRDFGAKAMVDAPPLDGALHMAITIYVTRPVSWSRRQIAEKPIPTGKPDLDNVAKLVADSLNGIVYWDDSQIASLHVERHYSETGERCEILIRQMAAEERARAA